MNSFEEYAIRIIEQLGNYDFPKNENNSNLQRSLKSIEEDSTLIEIEAKVNETLDLPVIEEPERETIENGILANGMESLAFYKSMHFLQQKPFPGKWGIFIFDYGISYLSNEIASFYPDRFSKKERDYFASLILLLHEQFHFLFDAWAISIESVIKKPLYSKYHFEFYQAFYPTELVLEETLANLNVLNKIKRLGIYKFAKEFMISQTGAYSNIFHSNRDSFFKQLAAQFFFAKDSIFKYRFCPEHEPFIANSRNEKQFVQFCNVFLIRNANPSIFIDPIIFLPTISEIDKGFLKKYCDGVEKFTDHKYYRIDNKQKVKVPNPHQKNVKLREFKNIIMKAGLRHNEYFEERLRTSNWNKNVPRNEIKQPLI